METSGWLAMGSQVDTQQPLALSSIQTQPRPQTPPLSRNKVSSLICFTHAAQSFCHAACNRRDQGVLSPFKPPVHPTASPSSIAWLPSSFTLLQWLPYFLHPRPITYTATPIILRPQDTSYPISQGPSLLTPEFPPSLEALQMFRNVLGSRTLAPPRFAAASNLDH